MQQLQKVGTLCQSLPNQSCKADTGRRYRQQYGVLTRNRSYSIRQRHKSCRFLRSHPIGGGTTNRIHHRHRFSSDDNSINYQSKRNPKATSKCFVDVNKNPIKFKGVATVEVKTEKIKIPILITENIQPLLGLDWLDKLEIGLQGSNEVNIIRNITASKKGEKTFEEFENRFKKNHTIKDLTIDIQMKKDTKSIEEKGRPVPIHFQKILKNELEKLIKKDTWKKRTKRPKTALFHQPS